MGDTLQSNDAQTTVKKIFIGPVEICGIAKALEAGFTHLGHKAIVALSSPHIFNYGNNQTTSRLHKLWGKLGQLRYQPANQQFVKKLFFYAAHSVVSWVVLLNALFRFDAFLFLFSQTITNTKAELWLLRAFNKKIVFIYVGSDARPLYMDGGECLPIDSLDIAQLVKKVVAQQNRLRYQERMANYIVNSPSCAHFSTKPYINWFCMGVPKVVNSEELSMPQQQAVRILHSPSNAKIKGTAVIKAAITNLQKKGHEIEFILLENMSNAQVLQELARCDFVVDQLYSDTPMAVLATEAAHFAKASVVGGYFSQYVSNTIPTEAIPPSLYVMPDTIEAAIEKMILQPEFRKALGLRAQQFVRSAWNYQAVAARYLRLLNDDVPQAWYLNPQDTDYLYGCGLSAEDSATVVAGLTEFGRDALLLVDDKPLLKQQLLQRAYSDANQHV